MSSSQKEQLSSETKSREAPPLAGGEDVTRLREEFGDNISQWWHEGIPQKIRMKAREEAENSREYNHPEKFLYLIDWLDIISKNFALFGEIFTINAKPTDSKNKRLTWLRKINEIRNIVDHPPRGGVSDDQLEYLAKIHDEFILRLKNEVK